MLKKRKTVKKKERFPFLFYFPAKKKGEEKLRKRDYHFFPYILNLVFVGLMFGPDVFFFDDVYVPCYFVRDWEGKASFAL